MFLTAAICTWNRAPTLDRTLAEMRGLRVPEGVEWELLVVNNNCTDATDEAIARHAGDLPIRRLFQPVQGLSVARNAAIEAARGELILWTDDDVLVEPQWLAGYADAAERWPEAAYFGGTILPWYECPPPPWIAANLDLLKGMLVVRDLGPAERPFAADESPFGANMAFRRRVFEDCRFDVRLGVSGGASILGEETALIERLRERGECGVWVPSACIRHLVPASRMTGEYLAHWAEGWGRTTVRMDRMRSAAGRTDCQSVLQVPDWRLRVNCWRYWLRAWRQRLLRQPAWAASYYHYASIRGMLAELRVRDA